MGPSLLSLPRELRDEIWRLVLVGDISVSPDLPYDKDYGHIIRSDPCELMEGRVCFPLQVPVHSTALLQCNRQIQIEVSETIARLTAQPGGLSCKLDVLALDEQHFYLTWIRLPVASNQYDLVEVDFRIVGHCAEAQKSLFRRKRGKGPARIIFCIYQILFRYLYRGPRFFSADNEQVSTIPKIVLNVVSPQVPSEAFRPPQDLNKPWTPGEIQTDIVNPRSVIEYMELCISTMFKSPTGMLCHTEVLWEKLGTICLCLDGERVKEWNIKTDLSRPPWADWYTYS